MRTNHDFRIRVLLHCYSEDRLLGVGMRKFLCFIVFAAVAFVVPAPVAHAAAPTGVEITLVKGGYLMAYAEWKATGATGYELSAWNAASEGSRVGFNVMSSNWRTSNLVFMRAGTPGGTYYLELTATNGAHSTVSPRVAFTVTNDPSIATDPAAAVPALSDPQGVKNGVQVYTNLTAGTYSEGTLLFFNTVDGLGAPAGGPGSFIYEARPTNLDPVNAYVTDPLFPSGTKVFAAFVGYGPAGFSPWSSRVEFTPNDAAPWGPGVAASGGVNSASVSWSLISRTGVTPPTVTGYRVDYTTDNGASWSTAIANTGTLDTSATIPSLTAGQSYRFRVAGYGEGAVLGGWSSASAAVIPTRATQTVSWSPSNTSAVATAGTLTPSALAFSNGDGAVTYSIAADGSTPSANCAVNSSTAVLTFSGAGTCTVKATAAQTATFAEGTQSVSFNITAPPPPPSPSGGGGGGGSESPASPTVPTPAPTPATAPPTPSPTAAPDPVNLVLSLTPTQVQQLSPSQLSQLPPAAFAEMSPAQVRALNPEQVRKVTPEQVRALPPSVLRAMKPRTLNQLSVAAIRSLTVAQARQLRPQQIQALGPVKRKAVTAKR